MVGQEREKDRRPSRCTAYFLRESNCQGRILLIPMLQQSRDEGLFAFKVVKQTGMCHMGPNRNLPQ